MKFDALCDEVLGIDDIQSVFIINKMGRAVEKKSRDGAAIVDGKKNEILMMQSVLVMSMARDFDDDFGKIRYVHTQRKNLSMLSFPLDGHIVLVSSKTALSLTRLLKRLAILNAIALPDPPKIVEATMKQNTSPEIIMPIP
jgi:hypothetical protein